MDYAVYLINVVSFGVPIRTATDAQYGEIFAGYRLDLFAVFYFIWTNPIFK